MLSGGSVVDVHIAGRGEGGNGLGSRSPGFLEEFRALRGLGFLGLFRGEKAEEGFGGWGLGCEGLSGADVLEEGWSRAGGRGTFYESYCLGPRSR